MSAGFDPLERWRQRGRIALHDGLARLRKESPPDLARRIAGFDHWLREQERRVDRNSERVQEAWYDLRRRLAAGVRRLERAVRPS